MPGAFLCPIPEGVKHMDVLNKPLSFYFTWVDLPQ
jgi:hypothetical protein